MELPLQTTVVEVVEVDEDIVLTELSEFVDSPSANLSKASQALFLLSDDSPLILAFSAAKYLFLKGLGAEVEEVDPEEGSGLELPLEP